jgi:hypothetical protein
MEESKKGFWNNFTLRKWGFYFIWFLIGFFIVTLLVSILAGMIKKDQK